MPPGLSILTEIADFSRGFTTEGELDGDLGRLGIDTEDLQRMGKLGDLGEGPAAVVNDGSGLSDFLQCRDCRVDGAGNIMDSSGQISETRLTNIRTSLQTINNTINGNKDIQDLLDTGEAVDREKAMIRIEMELPVPEIEHEVGQGMLNQLDKLDEGKDAAGVTDVEGAGQAAADTADAGNATDAAGDVEDATGGGSSSKKLDDALTAFENDDGTRAEKLNRMEQALKNMKGKEGKFPEGLGNSENLNQYCDAVDNSELSETEKIEKKQNAGRIFQKNKLQILNDGRVDAKTQATHLTELSQINKKIQEEFKLYKDKNPDLFTKSKNRPTFSNSRGDEWKEWKRKNDITMNQRKHINTMKKLQDGFVPGMAKDTEGTGKLDIKDFENLDRDSLMKTPFGKSKDIRKTNRGKYLGEEKNAKYEEHYNQEDGTRLLGDDGKVKDFEEGDTDSEFLKDLDEADNDCPTEKEIESAAKKGRRFHAAAVGASVILAAASFGGVLAKGIAFLVTSICTSGLGAAAACGATISCLIHKDNKSCQDISQIFGCNNIWPIWFQHLLNFLLDPFTKFINSMYAEFDQLLGKSAEPDPLFPQKTKLDGTDVSSLNSWLEWSAAGGVGVGLYFLLEWILPNGTNFIITSIIVAYSVFFLFGVGSLRYWFKHRTDDIPYNDLYTGDNLYPEPDGEPPNQIINDTEPEGSVPSYYRGIGGLYSYNKDIEERLGSFGTYSSMPLWFTKEDNEYINERISTFWGEPEPSDIADLKKIQPGEPIPFWSKPRLSIHKRDKCYNIARGVVIILFWWPVILIIICFLWRLICEFVLPEAKETKRWKEMVDLTDKLKQGKSNIQDSMVARTLRAKSRVAGLVHRRKAKTEISGEVDNPIGDMGDWSPERDSWSPEQQTIGAYDLPGAKGPGHAGGGSLNDFKSLFILKKFNNYLPYLLVIIMIVSYILTKNYQQVSNKQINYHRVIHKSM